MKTNLNLWISIPGLLVLLGGQAQTSYSQQFIAAKNIAPSSSVGGPFATGDVNRDGHLDIIAYDASKNSYVVLLGNGNGTFTEKVPTTPILFEEDLRMADVNGDGFPDLVMAHPGGLDGNGNATGYGKVTVYLGDGTGDFRQTWSANIGADIAELFLGDVNGDGHLDVITCTDIPYQGTGYVQVFLGDGKGSFQQKGGAQAFNLLTAGDLNGDGKADLVIVGGTQINGVQILLSNGDGTFKAGASYGVSFDSFAPVVIADFNHDGHKDLAVIDGFSGKTSILLGKGDGTFSIKSQFSNTFPAFPGGVNLSLARSASAADLNGDGNLDLVTFSSANFSSPTNEPTSTLISGIVSVNLGRGDGTFATAKNFSASPASGLATGDFNQDGHEDVVVGGFDPGLTQGELHLLLGTASGNLQAPLNTLSRDPFSIVPADFNHDGIQDVAVVNQGCGGCNTTVSVYLGTGKGYFTGPKTFTIGQQQGSIAAGDVNGDGKVDIVVTRSVALNTTNEDTSVLLGNGDGTFRPAMNSVLLGPPKASNAVWLVDMNRDGKLDLVGDWGVALGRGDGTFQPPKAFPYTLDDISGVGVGDLNGDGIQDVVLYGFPFSTIQTLLGDGKGGFTVKSTFSYPHYMITDLKVAKVYGGAERDLVFCGQSVDAANPRLSTNLVATVHGNGDGTFGTKKIVPLPLLPLSLSYGDYDRDGKLDVVVNDSMGIRYLRGTGTGSFYAPQFFPGVATYLQSLDLNKDGALDVVGITPIGFERLVNTGKRN